MNARIAELEDLAEQARLRAAKLEKEKNKLTVEIRELTIELETVSERNISAISLWIHRELWWRCCLNKVSAEVRTCCFKLS